MNYDFYPRAQTFDLRDELHGLLHGDFTQPGVGRPLLIRRIQDRRCICFKDLTGSPLPGCGLCKGEGYLWTEAVHTGYIGKNLGSVLGATTVIANQNALAPWGFADENKALAYFEYDVFPNYERYLRPEHPTCDKLFELKVDEEGGLVTPYIRTAKWKMKSVTPHYGDFGAIQFFEVGLEKESI
jgi:hypothetical protein